MTMSKISLVLSDARSGKHRKVLSIRLTANHKVSWSYESRTANQRFAYEDVLRPATAAWNTVTPSKVQSSFPSKPSDQPASAPTTSQHRPTPHGFRYIQRQHSQPVTRIDQRDQASQKLTRLQGRDTCLNHLEEVDSPYKVP